MPLCYGQLGTSDCPASVAVKQLRNLPLARSRSGRGLRRSHRRSFGLGSFCNVAHVCTRDGQNVVSALFEFCGQVNKSVVRAN